MGFLQRVKSWFVKKPEQVQHPIFEVGDVEEPEVVVEKIAEPEVAEVVEPIVGPGAEEVLDTVDITLEETPPIKIVEFYHNYFILKSDPFSTRWNQPTEFLEMLGWRSENARVVRELHNMYGDALSLFVNGSVESQIMLAAFKDAEITPRIFALHLQGSEEVSSDIKIVLNFYKTMDFKMRVVDTPSSMYWNNTALEYSISHGVIRAEEAMRIWAATSAGGVPMMAGNLPFCKKTDDTWYMGDHQQYFIADNYIRENNIPAIPSFVRFSPWQLSCYLQESTDFATSSGHTTTFDSLAFAKHAYPEIDFEQRVPSKEEKLFERQSFFRNKDKISLCWHEVGFPQSDSKNS